MKPGYSVSRFLTHMTALTATTLLGFAIATTHHTVWGQAKSSDQKSQPTDKTKTKSDQAAGEKRPTHKGHALGMTVEAQGNEGLMIANVEDSGVAGRAGLKQGDRIVSADGRTFQRPRQLEAYLASHGGRPIQIVVMRDGRQQSVMYVGPHRAGDSAWLGVFLEEGESGVTGARITQVYPGGPAARGGLQPGDVVTQVNETKIESPADLIATMAEFAPQTAVNFTVMRDEHEQKLPVTLGAYQHFMPQNGNGADNGQYQAGHEAFENVPPYAMQLEHDRREAEQHERIEQEIRALRDEIRQLRDELKQRK